MRRSTALVGAVAALSTILATTATSAFADTVSNNVTAGGSPSVVAGESTSIGYSIQNVNSKDGDTQNSCNPGDATPATLTVVAPAAVSVTPATRTFSACGAAQSFDFSSTTPGSYTITVSVTDAGGGIYTTSAAAFTLTVTKPVVVNTAPSVVVSGVTNGASYEFGNVPAATCNVIDKEDGNSSVDASLSTITGTRAVDGLGSQTASCDYTDKGGLNATASRTYSIVDTTKPLVTVTAPASTEATAASTPVVFGASANDAVDGSRPVVCATAGGTAYASGDGFPVGTTALTCSATDKAGNVGVSDPFFVVVTDTTKPVVTVPSNVVVGNDEPTVTYDAATATDKVDGTVSTTCVPASGSAFKLGETTVTCSATDTARNTGTGTFTVTVQDTTKPVVNVQGNLTEEATGPAGAQVAFDPATATDDVDGPLSATCDRESGTVFALGTTVVNCSATDAAKNTSTNSFSITVQDTTAPALSLPEDVTAEATSAAGALVTFSATASDLVDGKVATTCVPASGSTFALGTHQVTCTATDAAGTPATGTFAVSVVDTTKPIVTAPAATTAEATGPNGAEVTYDGASATDTVDGSVPTVCKPVSGSQFALGSTEVTCTATDAAGNTGSASSTVTVRDTEPPVITTPANVVAGNTSPAGAVVTYAAATAEDLVTPNVAASCLPASGTAFPLGTTTVTCSAKDAAGNPATKKFTVEVQDRTKPIVTVPGTVTKEATSAAGAVATWIGVSATDDVDGTVPTTCIPVSGSTFALGTTKVTCSATDAAKNTGDSTFDVVVVDTTAPNLTVSAAKTAVATSAAGAVVNYTAPTAKDIVDGAVAASCDLLSGSTFPLGSTTVTCTAKDTAGNTGTETFTVTVTAAWSGVLQPVNADGSSVFKLGSTVPVKFTLTGASAGIKDLTAKLMLQRTSGAGVGTVLEATSTSSATTGNLFRYDATAGQYIFNLGTKTLSAGGYQLQLELGDSVARTVNITLR